MRPVRAGSSADDALVEIELTVGNSGSVAAHDVRISTFMFASEAASQSEMDRLLLERNPRSQPSPRPMFRPRRNRKQQKQKQLPPTPRKSNSMLSCKRRVTGPHAFVSERAAINRDYAT